MHSAAHATGRHDSTLVAGRAARDNFSATPTQIEKLYTSNSILNNLLSILF